MQPFSRIERIADLIHKEIAVMLRTEAFDPRFVDVTVLSVKVAPDLSQARIFFALLDATKVKETTKALNKAAGFLRTGLAKAAKLRRTPALVFVYDEIFARGQHLSDLIDSVND